MCHGAAVPGSLPLGQHPQPREQRNSVKRQTGKRDSEKQETFSSHKTSCSNLATDNPVLSTSKSLEGDSHLLLSADLADNTAVL